MSLSSGVRLGPYEILSKLGEGGMGEVYKARDTRLERTVAIKVLPEHGSGSLEQRVRFEREARTIAALNHPNICTVHDVGETRGAIYLVMEHLAGDSLAARLAKGPLPAEQALTIAGEIADALAAAHRQGVVHRDLKPDNVMLTRSGAKLLDFGVAKLRGHGERAAVGDPDSSLTQSDSPTVEGAIVGTLHYMAPEQVEGRPVDGRTDIWALGLIIYEMLTGRRAFGGPSAASLVASILDSQPPELASLQRLASPALERLVRHCLAKDPEQRWQSAADVAEELRGIAADAKAPPASAAVRRRSSWWLAGAVVVTALVAAWLTWAPWRRGPAAPSPVGTHAMAIPGDAEYPLDVPSAPSLAISADGSVVVYVASDGLYRHAVGEAEGRRMPIAAGAIQPFLSPDGEWLGFWRDGKLVRVKLRGGDVAEGTPALDVADAAVPRGASWGDDGTILFCPVPTAGLWRVSADGGPAREVTHPDPAKGELSHRWPSFLPGGRAALFTVMHVSQRQDKSTIAVVSLDTGRVAPLVVGGAFARYSSTGHLVYARNGSLWAVPFDLPRLRVTGSPVPVANHVHMQPKESGGAEFALAAAGALVYAPSPVSIQPSRLIWIDDSGRVEPVVPEPRDCKDVVLSPGGDHLAVVIEDSAFRDQIWTYDLHARRWRQLTFEGDNQTPVWSPAGRRLAFRSNREGGFQLYVMEADGGGTAVRLTHEWYNSVMPDSWSPDERLLLFHAFFNWGASAPWVVPLAGGRPPQRWGPEHASAGFAVFSPDGRWVAHQMRESGSVEVWARPFAGPGPGVRVSGATGGFLPTWSRDGRTIWYATGDGRQVMAASVEPGATLRVSAPHVAFVLPSPLVRPLQVEPDGRRAVMVQKAGTAAIRHLVLVSDWAAQLKANAKAK